MCRENRLDHLAPEPSNRRILEAEIEYHIVALALAASDIVAVIEKATGVTVRPDAANFLRVLDTTQLEATRRFLSHHPRWQPRRKL